MTTFERFERDIPALMDEIAPPRLPDYLDDMLRQTNRTRQRPAWASLERWLPMDVVARPAPFRAPALRPLLILILIGLLIAAGLALYAGTQRTKLPAPFGPAKNGAVFVTTDGDIVAVDPVTGSRTLVVGGPAQDIAPWLSRDGRHLLFLRTEGGRFAQWIANPDGSNARELVPAPVGWAEWAPEGDRIVSTRDVGVGGLTTSIVNVEDGTSTVIDPSFEINAPYWRPGHDEIVYVRYAGDHAVYILMNADGSGRHPIEGVSADAINEPVLSADGSKLVYSTWAEGTGLQGRIHVVDIDSGVDRALMFDGSGLTNEFPHQYSPDGSKLLIERYGGDSSFEVDGEQGYRLVIVPADGGGPVLPIGPAMPSGTDGATAEFSPDGTQVLAFYRHDRSTWLLEADGSGGVEVDWNPQGEFNWQRLAP